MKIESLKLIHSIIESRFRMQHDLVESLDLKISSAIAFIAIIIVLLFQVDSANKTFCFYCAIVFLIVALIMLFWAYKTEKYRRDPDPRKLTQKYCTKDEDKIISKVIANIVNSYEENREKVRIKAKLFSTSLIFIGVSLVCLVILLI